MKKILISSLSVIALAILGTGCLKDKDFKDQAYGTQPAYAPGVSFPSAAVDTVITFGLISQATPYDMVGPHIALEGTGPIGSDVHVTLAIDNSLVDSVNARHGLGLLVLDPSEYSLDLNRTIVAGQPFDSVIVHINNLAGLNPNDSYAIGLNITNVDNGFQILSLKKSIVVQINIRNKWDGIYHIESGHVQRYTGAAPEVGPLNGDLAGNPDISLVTTGSNTLTIPGTAVPGHLMWAAGSGSAVSGTDPLRIEIDGSNNVIITSPVLLPGNLANWAGHANSYDDATQTMSLAFTWINTSGNLREYEMVLKYVGPRP